MDIHIIAVHIPIKIKLFTGNLAQYKERGVGESKTSCKFICM